MRMARRALKGMGRIYRRGTSWWLDYTEAGVRHRHPLRTPDGEPCRTRQEAEAERRRLRAPALTRDELTRARAAQAETERLEARLAGEELAQAPGLEAAWAEYVRHPQRRQCSPGTLYMYHGQWERMLEWLRRERPQVRRLDAITPQVAGDYADALRRSGLSATTRNRHIVFLRGMLRLLLRGADPLGGVPLERVRQASRRALTRDELSRLLASAEGDVRSLMVLGAATGLRLGDCCTLMWSEVDDAVGCVRRRTRKTGSTVAVPLPAPVREALGERGTGAVLPRMAALYASGRSGRDRIAAELRRAWDAAGIEMHEAERQPGRARRAVVTGFHALRHTWVSAMSEGGAPPALIQAAVGHASPAMTEHYTHLTEEGLRSVADAVGRALMPSDPERDALERRVRELLPRADDAALRRALDALAGATPSPGGA